MAKQDQKLARTAPSVAAFTFPRDLVKPQQTQVTQYADAVAHRIAELDAVAAQLAGGFGIPFTSFELNPVELPATADVAVQVALGVLSAIARRTERVTLERRGQQWGLYFTREPAAVLPNERPQTVALRDAPLDVRERFLAASERFFQEYLALCADRLGTMKGAVAAADRTLEMLRAFRVE